MELILEFTFGNNQGLVVNIVITHQQKKWNIKNVFLTQFKSSILYARSELIN